MKQYLVSGFTYLEHGADLGGGFERIPLVAKATLEPHEVMDPTTVQKVEQILMLEARAIERTRPEGMQDQIFELRIHSFQPFETSAEFVPVPPAAPHLNECSVVMPPVDSPLLIELAPGVLLKATRDEHAESRNDLLRFRLEHGGFFTGRPRWTHP